jgi:hypothetical protein
VYQRVWWEGEINEETTDIMDMDLGLMLGPIVLAVVVNVILHLERILPRPVYVTSSTGRYVRNVHYPVVQLLYLWV